MSESTPQVPRLSTTVLLVRDGPGGLEVLMVIRHEKAYLASAMVFPGGVLEAADADPAWLDLITGAEGLDAEERVRRIGGFRELYEETGLLLLSADAVDPGAPAEPMSLLDVVAQSGGRLDLSAMAPFAHWLTPVGAPKRFDTHFRICWMRTESVAVSDGRETVAAEWLRPVDAIELGTSRQRILLPPTRCQLDLLAQSATVEEAVTAARARKITRVTPSFTRKPDGTYITIPPDAGYPVLEHIIER